MLVMPLSCQLDSLPSWVGVPFDEIRITRLEATYVR